MKWEPRAWGYNWATLSLGGHKCKRPGPRDWGLGARLTTFLCKNKIIVAESEEVKTGQILQNHLKKALAQKVMFCQ
jgi:hypothetical protein